MSPNNHAAMPQADMPHADMPGGLSRRHVVMAGVAAASSPVWSGVAGPGLTESAEAATLPSVKPKWSHLAYESFGVNSMPNHIRTAYQYRRQWMQSLDGLGVRYFRGMWGRGSNSTYDTAALAREMGLKWGMTVIPTLSMSDDAIRASIADISARAASTCIYVEGVNEPNYPRQLGYVPTNWRQLTLQKQRVLWQAVRSHGNLAHVKVLSPSLQMVKATASDYEWFARNGLLNYMSHCGTHLYPGGHYPDHTMDSRLAPMRKYWPKPVWVTETGYNNALATTGGHKPVPEDVAAIYGPSTILEAVDRNYQTVWFEALDDPDAGAKDEIEANLGMWALQSNRQAPPWRAKPVVPVLKAFLAELRDPGAAYSPRAIGLKVSSSASDVRWTALGKRDGSVRLYLRRARDCWDPQARVRLRVPAVATTITTAQGSRTVSVGSQVVTVRL